MNKDNLENPIDRVILQRPYFNHCVYKCSIYDCLFYKEILYLLVDENIQYINKLTLKGCKMFKTRRL